MLNRIYHRIRNNVQHRNADSRPPEEYWVRRGKQLIGFTDLQGLQNSFGSNVYTEIWESLKSRDIQDLLDLGCNYGALGQLLNIWNYQGRYTGIDNNPYAIEEAKKRFSATPKYQVQQGNIRQISFSDNQFEGVVMKDVLEHMEDFKPFLEEAARLAKKYLIVANFIPWTEGDAVHRREKDGFFHNLYKRSEVYEFLRQRHFEVEEVIGLVDGEARANEVVIFKRVAVGAT